MSKKLMLKRIFIVVPALAVVIIILTEDISVRGVFVALAVSSVAVFFSAKYLPVRQVSNIKFFRLVTYPLYLIWMIYYSGFQVIKIILKGSRVEVVTVATDIKSEILRVILVDSITLTPGSVLLDLDGERVTLLWIRDKNTPPGPVSADKQLKEKLERRLKKAERKPKE
jgi:multicomponent Na+:H+ antiporter subunit E